MTVYDEYGHPTTKGGKNPFPVWSPLDLEMQREARAEIHTIPPFPALEKRIIGAFGPTAEAIMLHQLVYWFRKGKMQDRWTAYKTYAEWKDERGLNRKQVDKARRRLSSSGVVEERKGPYKKIHYRIDWVRLAERLGLWDELKGDGVDEDDFFDPDLSDFYPKAEAEAPEVDSVSTSMWTTRSDTVPLLGGADTDCIPFKGDALTVPPLRGADLTVPPTSSYKEEEHPRNNRRSGGSEPLDPRCTPTHESVQEGSSRTYEQDSTPAGAAEPVFAAPAAQSDQERKDRVRGMIDAAMSNNDMAAIGDDREWLGTEEDAAHQPLGSNDTARQHRHLARLIHGEDGKNEVSRIVDRYLAGDEDESETTTVEGIAAKARELVTKDRSLAYFVGAVEFHLEEMR